MNTQVLDDYTIEYTVDGQGNLILTQDALEELLSIFEGMREDYNQLIAAHSCVIEGINKMRARLRELGLEDEIKILPRTDGGMLG